MLATLLLNIFSETTWSVKVKFHVGPPWDGGKEDYSNDPGHITKMAAIPVNGINLKNSSLDLSGRFI